MDTQPQHLFLFFACMDLTACRTCESMAVEALVLSNRSVAATDAFKRQSVTSERWLQLLEVALPDLPTFLQERKEAGYTIVGALW